MGYDPSEYVDEGTRREIEKAISFFLEAGVNTHDEICSMVSKDFDVPKTFVLKVLSNLLKQKTKGSS